MGSTLFIILLTIAALGVAVVLFAGWLIVLIVSLVKGTLRVGGRLLGTRRRVGRSLSAASVTCPRRRCGAENPRHARFCRRCGMALPNRRTGAVVASLQRAALW